MMRRRALLACLLALAAPGAGLAADGEKKRVGSSTYVDIEAVTGATTKLSGRRGVLVVDCGLDIPDPALRARAVSMAPRLRAAYVQIVAAYAAGLPPNTAPNADFLAQALQRETNTVLGRPGARLLLGALLSS